MSLLQTVTTIYSHTMSDTPLSPEEQQALIQQFKEAKYESARLRGRIIGALEFKLMLFQSMVEATQAELDQERRILRLLVREHTGQLTTEEQIELKEATRVADTEAQ